jgi:DNA-3-methyladenine glycosylase II
MRLRAPYDFQRSTGVVSRFADDAPEAPGSLQIGLRLGERPVVLTVSAKNRRAKTLALTASAPVSAEVLEAWARWVLFDDLDLAPYYRIAEPHPVMGPIVRELWGVKPMRPASLLEMAVIVITEQQISLAAANRIRARFVEHFGDQVDGVWVFPTAKVLARASLAEIRGCGYSQRKAEYIRDFAALVNSGGLDLESLKILPEADVYERLLGIRGWGPWSANYFLVRGLARPDCVPTDDLAIRTVVGKYLGAGGRATAAEVAALVEPFRPYRGLTAFYLLAYAWQRKA